MYIVGRRENVLKDAAKTAKNGTLVPLVGDVTDKDSLKAMVAHIERDEGSVNFLFANAGIAGPNSRASVPAMKAGGTTTVQEFSASLLETPMSDFTQVLNTNVTAVFYTALAFLPLLEAANNAGPPRRLAQDSQILITSSVAGFSRHLASGFAYNVSKAAVNHLAKMIATVSAQHRFHVRCNVVAPGLYPSEMTAGIVSKLDGFTGPAGHEGAFAGAVKMGTDRSPAERTGSEEDFAGTVLFMASRAGSYLNGEVLVSDGGRLSQLPATY